MANSNPKPKPAPFTYADYINWPEDERWELINGQPYDMSPVPTRKHQKILGNLFRIIADITDKSTCETYVAPFDIRLSEIKPDDTEKNIQIVKNKEVQGEDNSQQEDNTITTVVQPDISVFCNKEFLDEQGACGAPDLAVEILSQHTSYKDQTAKLNLYEKHGVKEYWVVNGEAPFVMIYRLDKNGTYKKPDYYKAGEQAESTVLGGEKIALNRFIPDTRNV